MAQMTTDLCEAKHGELMRAMEHIENKVDSVLSMLNGNGKPGLRETQNDVSELKEWRRVCIENRELTLWRFVRPALPIVYGLIAFLIWFALNNQFG